MKEQEEEEREKEGWATPFWDAGHPGEGDADGTAARHDTNEESSSTWEEDDVAEEGGRDRGVLLHSSSSLTFSGMCSSSFVWGNPFR